MGDSDDMGDSDLPPVHHDADRSRFVIRTEAGDAEVAYQRATNLIVFTHTEVPKEAEGQGVGSRLARAALDWARTEGVPVLPLCPFVAAYVRRHADDYGDLLMPGVRL